MADSEKGKDWQFLMKNIKERLQYVYTSEEENSDLDIVFPEYELTFKAHRMILSISSSVFGAMLMGPLATGKELILPMDSPHTFQKLLDHIYLDQMDLESVKQALEVYALAHKYQMESVRETCVQYIISNMKEETLLAVLETSVVYEDKVLNNKCKEMLDLKPDTSLLSETVSYLSKESLKNLLMDRSLKFSSEIVPFKALIAWGKAQLAQQEEPSGSAVREKIGDLLKEIRFLDMSCNEFVDSVIDTGVLTHAECIHILRAIRGADPSSIPETVPLNPALDMRLSRKEVLSCINLSGGYNHGYRSGNTLSPSSDVGLIENLVSNRNIYIHYMQAPNSGTIQIVNDISEVVSSATSEGCQFTFTKPVALEKDKQYKVMFCPKTSVRLLSASGTSQTVGNVSISSSRNFSCALYFCESKRR
ncbi:BTB/POZ domain-containing protein 3-like [Oratosquilla oratoria]|uniref:BTB/POZ domain-containing protein 3-like n=1 Tax=Oratosquilla oratoria TaxID=337810 RepID=UPI003F76F25C